MFVVERTGPMKRVVWTSALYDELLRLRRLGLSREQVCRELGLSFSQVRNGLNRAGIAFSDEVDGAEPVPAAPVPDDTLSARPVPAQRAHRLAAIVLECPAVSRAELMQRLGLDAPKLSEALNCARRLGLVSRYWQPVPAVRMTSAATLPCNPQIEPGVAQWLAAIAARARKLAGTTEGRFFACGLDGRPRDALTPYAEEAAAMLRESAARPGEAQGCFWVDDPAARRDLHGREMPFRDLSFSPIGSTSAACLGGC